MKRFLIIIPVFLFIVLAACEGDGEISNEEGTKVAQTQTAKMVSPTPTATPIPNQAIIINALNGAMRGADPLGEGIDARFYVEDVEFKVNENPPKLIIQVECENVYKPSCSAERSFVVLMHVFQKEGVRTKVFEQIPDAIKTFHVKAFVNRSQIGLIEVSRQDLLDYAKGDITGDQLAVRAKRLTP